MGEEIRPHQASLLGPSSTKPAWHLRIGQQSKKPVEFVSSGHKITLCGSSDIGRGSCSAVLFIEQQLIDSDFIVGYL